MTKVASYAFANASHLRFVYASNDTMEWETSTNAIGETIYSSFVGTSGIKILREKNTFTTAESGVTFYDMITHGYAWNPDDDVIEFEQEFTTSYTYCFIKFLDGNKFSIAIFEFDSTADEPAIVEGSLIVLEKVLSE